MIISELLAKKQSTGVISVIPETSLLQASRTLRNHNIGALIVADQECAAVGIVSERDIIKALAAYGSEAADLPVANVMTRNIVSCAPSDGVAEVIKLMNSVGCRHIPVMQNGKPTAVISIREFDQAYAQLQKESRTDELTALANRRSFLETLDREMNRRARFGSSIALAAIDVDHFKRVNDVFGHSAGDDVLRAIAGVMAGELRSYDSVGRIGGEEFAIVFPNTDAGAALTICTRLLAAIRTREIRTAAGVISVTVSIGITDSSIGVTEGRFLLESADAQLYVAKKAGRNRIAVNPATRAQLSEAHSSDQLGEVRIASVA